MTTVTLKTDEELLAKASDAIARRNMSLEEFWEKALREVAGETDGDVMSVAEAMSRLKHLKFEPPYSRDEMHER